MRSYSVRVKPAPLALAAPSLPDPDKALAHSISDGQGVLFARLVDLSSRSHRAS